MPKVIKRGPADDDLGQVTVIDESPAGTVHRFRFDVTAKNRANFRRVNRPSEYGDGRPEEPDNGGICAGETLVLTTHMSIVEGRQAQVGADAVPRHVVEELRAEGATEVRA